MKQVKRWWLAVLLGVVALGAAGAALVGANRDPPRPPNVLVLLWDTVRADRMSLYGHGVDTTPRIAAWAEKHGVVFERAMSPDMWTIPSHASLFTGLAPSTHGANLDHRLLDAHRTTLAEWFYRRGYDTYAFSANPNLRSDRYGLLQGFTDVDLSWGDAWVDKVSRNTRQKLMRMDRSTEISMGRHRYRSKRAYAYNAGPIAHEAFVRWLDRREDPERPFFAYLSYMEAHKPRVPSQESRRSIADDVVIWRALDMDFRLSAQLLYTYGKLEFRPEDLEAIRATYDASLRELDDATADLLADLGSRGLLHDTVVVLTADHGEQLGEHGLFGHRAGLYQALLHVPLVISYPAKLAPGRVTTPVSNLHLFDTILDLARLPKPDTGYVAGNVFEAGRQPPKPLFAETLSIDRVGFARIAKHHPDLVADQWAYTYRSVVDGDHKLLQTVDFDDHHVVKCELFDLVADPGEQRDLAPEQQERVRALAALLGDWKRATPIWDPDQAEVPVTATGTSDRRLLQIAGYLEPEEGEVDPHAAHPMPDPRAFDDASLASRCP